MRRAALLACAGLLAWVDGQQLTIGGSRGPDRVDYVYKPLRGTSERANQGGIFSGIVPGAAIVAAAGSLLWWNEGRTMRRERLLETARRQLRHGGAAGDPLEIDPALPEQLLHLTGTLRSAGGVSDPIFPQVKGELGLERMSEVFQWLEDERVEEVRSSTPKTTPDPNPDASPNPNPNPNPNQVRTSSTHVRRETTYSYKKQWRHKAVESGRFRQSAQHHNPTPRLAPGVGTSFATDVTLDQWLLPPSLLQQLPWKNLGLAGGGGGGSGGGGGGDGDGTGVAEGGVAALALRVENAMLVPVTDDSRGGEALYLPLKPPQPPQGLRKQPELEMPGEVRDWVTAEGP